MIRILVALMASLGVLATYTPTPTAEACGVKLTTQAPNMERQHRSDNPSRILLVGSPPRQLERNLSNAGHDVDVVPDPGAASSGDYPVVVADQDQYQSAQARFDGQVVPRAGSTSANMERVEDGLQRAPRDAAGRPTVVAAGRGDTNDRDPVGAGRERASDGDERDATGAGRGPQAAGSGDDDGAGDRDPRAGSAGDDGDEDTAIATRPDQGDEQATPDDPDETRPTSPDESGGPDRADEGTDRPDAGDEQVGAPDRTDRDDRDESPRRDTAAGEFRDEVHFGTNQSGLGPRGQRAMRSTAAWLRENDDVTIVVEGHTNTPGNPNYNMQLSRQRAASVRDFLVQQGVDSDRIEVRARGEEDPAYGDGVDGRNRRVEIHR